MKYQGGFLISQIKQVSGRLLAQILSENNITEFNGPQGRILYILWQNESIPIQEIASKTGLAKTTLTSMLDNMEKNGLINRVFDKNDRRKILIFLTDTARSLQKQYDKVSKEMNDIFYSDFSPKEIEAFENTLVRVLNNLEQKNVQKNKKEDTNGQKINSRKS